MQQIEIYEKIDAAYKEFLVKCLSVKHHPYCESKVKEYIDSMLDATMDGLSDVGTVCDRMDSMSKSEDSTYFEYESLTGHEMGLGAGMV